MSKPIAHLTSTLSGKWRFEKLESPLLYSLRQRAVTEATNTETPWELLDSETKEKAEAVLATLVAENREELETTGAVVYDTGWKSNLILDIGLNYQCGTASQLGAFGLAVLGTGTTPTVYDSGTITATASGTGCTASSSFFTVGMEGMLIHWNSGEEAYIQTYNSGTSVTLGSATTATGEFSVYAVNRTGPASPSVYKSTTSNPTIVRSGGVSTQTLTWLFDLEVSNKVYTEGAVKNISESAPYWAVWLLSGGSVTVEIGQQARMSYSLAAAVNTATVSTSWPISFYDPSSPGGWNSTSGQSQVVSLRELDGWAVGASLLPSCDSGHDVLCLSTLSTLLEYKDDDNTSNTGIIGEAGGTKAAYVNGTFYRDSTYYFSTSLFNSSSIRSALLRDYFSCVAWQFLFDTPKTKDGEHGLSLTLRRGLRRSLVNT